MRPRLLHYPQVVRAQDFDELIKVAVRHGHRLRSICLAGCGCCGHLESPRVKGILMSTINLMRKRSMFLKQLAVSGTFLPSRPLTFLVVIEARKGLERREPFEALVRSAVRA